MRFANQWRQHEAGDHKCSSRWRTPPWPSGCYCQFALFWSHICLSDHDSCSCVFAYMPYVYPPRMDFTQCVPKAARKVHPGHLCCTGWWLCSFLQLRITLHLEFLLLFYFQQFHNEGSTLGFLHCDTVPFTFFFARLCLCPFRHPAALTDSHTAVRMRCLVSPSGPHWGLPLSSADNYCHLHVAQCDKHLASTGRSGTTLV